MKKLNIVLAIFAVVFCLGFKEAQATSGACSYHGGVSCSAGPTAYGTVICNDGSSDSSVQYSAMLECQDTRHSCNTSDLSQLQSKYNVTSLQATLSNLNAQVAAQTAALAAFDAQNAMTQGDIASQPVAMSIITGQQAAQAAKSALTRSSMVAAIGVLNAQVLAAQGNLNLATENVNQQCAALGEQEYDALLSSALAQPAPVTSTPQPAPTPSCGANSSLDPNNSNQCLCNTGYGLNSSSQCVPISNAYCASLFGQNIHAVSNQCVCDTGYVYNASSNSCKAQSVAASPKTSTPTPVKTPQVKARVTTAPVAAQSVAPQKSLTSSSTQSTAATAKVSIFTRIGRWFSSLF